MRKWHGRSVLWCDVCDNNVATAMMMSIVWAIIASTGVLSAMCRLTGRHRTRLAAEMLAALQCKGCRLVGYVCSLYMLWCRLKCAECARWHLVCEPLESSGMRVSVKAKIRM